MTWIEPISFTPSSTPGQALSEAAWFTISMPGTAAPTRKPPFSAAICRSLRDFLDIDQERGLDQVGFHLHDHVGAAGQDTGRPVAPASSATAACSVSGASYLRPSIALPNLLF